MTLRDFLANLRQAFFGGASQAGADAAPAPGPQPRPAAPRPAPASPVTASPSPVSKVVSQPRAAPPAVAESRPASEAAVLARDLRVNGRVVAAGTSVTIVGRHGGGSAYDIELSAPDRGTATVEGAALQGRGGGATAAGTRDAVLARDLRVQGRIVPAGTRATVLAEHGRGSAYDIELAGPDRARATVEGAVLSV